MTVFDATYENAIANWVQKAVGKINCQQGIYFDAVPTAGTWTITLDAVTSGAIQWDAAAAGVEAALEAMSNITSVTVTGDFIDGFEIEFNGADQYTDFSLFTVDVSGLSTTTEAYIWKHQSGRDGLIIIFAEQSKKRPTSAYCSINILVAGNKETEGMTTYDTDDTWTTDIKKTLTVSINIYADNLFMRYMSDLFDSVELDNIKAYLRANKLFHRSISGPNNLTNLENTAFRKRVQADFVFAYGEDTTENIKEIRRVSGTINNLDFDETI